MEKIIKCIVTILLVFTGSVVAKATVKMPTFFGDNMVVQQNDTVSFWGTAAVNAKLKVRVSWNNKIYTTKTDLSGNWCISIPTPKTDGKSHFLVFDDGSKDIVTLSNVLLGEVWFCSGQSNMEMPVIGFKGQPTNHSYETILHSNNTNLRLFTVKRASLIVPVDTVIGTWKEASPDVVRDFSATAYYFGKELQELLGVPVGIICSAWGGSPVEAWMSKEMLSDFSFVKIPQTKEDIKVKNRTPSTLFNGMIAPVVGIAIRGVIWYQGETNYDHPERYVSLFSAMVDGWRRLWGRDFPFYYCQIAPYEYELITPKGEKVINSAYLREAQLKASKVIPNSSMVVLMDAGREDCIHPRSKDVVGMRLAATALSKTYGKEGIECESPEYESMTISNDTVTLSFANAKMWLIAKNGKLNDFMVAGADRKFYPAEAWIYRTRVLVKSSFVSHPQAVRYAFTNWTTGNLLGAEGLSVSSFRTDDWAEEETSIVGGEIPEE